MDGPSAPCLHTAASPPIESVASAAEDGSLELFDRGARSSAVERSVHIGEVAGSIPAAPTVDHIARMLTDQAWRMRVEGRFWPKVMKPMQWDICWTWTGSKKSSGKDRYGGFKIKSHVTVRAHRLSYALYHGRSPGQMLVCHTCDNPECVNPMHLFLGTVKDNSIDMVRKGRQRSGPTQGEQNGAAKLTAVQVATIRDLIRAGLTNVAIAARYGVTHQLISRIRRGRSWGEAAMQPKYASLTRR